MRILWLTTNLLLPLDKGGKLRTWHLMRHLAARHERVDAFGPEALEVVPAVVAVLIRRERLADLRDRGFVHEFANDGEALRADLGGVGVGVETGGRFVHVARPFALIL